MLPLLEGAFSLGLMDAEHLVAVRDPHGFRPLCLGQLELDGARTGWVIASESPALAVVGAKFVREIEPGEMVVDRRGRAAQLETVAGGQDRSAVVPLRVRLLRPPGQPAARSRGLCGAAPHGRAARRPGTGRGRSRDGGARLGRVRRRGLLRQERHPVRPGAGEEPLHRAHVHRTRRRRPGPSASVAS